MHKLDEHQMATFQQIGQAMNNHNEHYSSIHEFSNISNDEDQDMFGESNDKPRELNLQNLFHSHLLIGKKIFLLTGEAGTAKSQIVLRAIEWSLENDLKVLVATTALLAIRYENVFDDTVTAETIYT